MHEKNNIFFCTASALTCEHKQSNFRNIPQKKKQRKEQVQEKSFATKKSQIFANKQNNKTQGTKKKKNTKCLIQFYNLTLLFA